MLPKGFKYAGVSAGLKDGHKKDLGVIVSDRRAVCAGITTTNQAAASCVKYNRRILRRGKARAIVVNTKFANACVGRQGDKDNLEMAKKTERLFGGPVLTASTGIIGQNMPMDKINKGIDLLAKNLTDNYDDFAEAILTTDLVVKKITKTIQLLGRDVTIAGAAKGSGMIHPNMATMLAFITTDAGISAGQLQRIIREVADISFNQVTVDGDTSTNDMCLCLANGASGARLDKNTLPLFRAALTETLIYLAKEIARDGEGATKLIEVNVNGARSPKEARLAARAAAGSPLVKCAVYGGDNNWGRVIAAVGRSGARFDPEKVKMDWAGLQTKEVTINIDLKQGKYSAQAWGCDLTEEYIKINTKYN
ncbi:MAG: bifunctional glutamate N-acetyltransferase/amino-acid acetyltransferase ArgJ [Candidatus Margulisbacteria bacterium]|jgi:glutamate N-acetyltransferase/amino-acid N-acetyltransferase|nr:bifunctional glutamate N-acetyltransferase/amino-acid acetyltransferase ArgJ [Candidatus Margulisiibacteriota bacterium]